MRKFIVKFFALDYIVPFFGKKINFTRSANVIFPLVLLCGALSLYDGEAPFFGGGWERILALSLLLLAIFFGFVYFLLFPLKEKDYNYFDEVQKFIWDAYHNRPTKEIKKYNSLWALWLNPIWIALFLVWYFLILKH